MSHRLSLPAVVLSSRGAAGRVNFLALESQPYAYTPPMSWSRLVLVAGLMAVLTTGSAWAQSTPDATAPASDSAAAAEPAPASTPAAPAVPPHEADRPLSRVLPNLARDLRRFPSLDTGLVLAIGGALGVAANNNDTYFTAHASAGGTDQIFAVGGELGNSFLHAGLALGTYAIGRLADKPAAAHVGADLIRAHLLTGLLTHSLKLAVRRDRPVNDTDHVGTHSFPSGHSAAAWTSSTVLWRHLGWKAGLPASALAAYVSTSRLQQNQHYMSDVLFGAAIGVASARTVTFGHGRRRLSITPAPVPGGGAIVVSVLPH